MIPPFLCYRFEIVYSEGLIGLQKLCSPYSHDGETFNLTGLSRHIFRTATAVLNVLLQRGSLARTFFFFRGITSVLRSKHS